MAAEGYPRTYGHQKGVHVVRSVIKKAAELGIEALTFYVFSTENWKRPTEEVEYLLRLLETEFRKEIEEFHRNNIRVCVLGRLEDFPESIRDSLVRGIKLTENNNRLIVNMALSYGGRDEIVRAVRKIVHDVDEGVLEPNEISEGMFSKYLDTSDLPDPDLVIRTGGNIRVSNFLLWQIAYAELFVIPKYWPDFTVLDLEEAVLEFQKRDRRFGGI